MIGPKTNAALADILANVLVQAHAGTAHHAASVKSDAVSGMMETWEDELSDRFTSHLLPLLDSDDPHELIKPILDLLGTPTNQTDFIWQVVALGGLILTGLPAAAAGKTSQVRARAMIADGQESIGAEAAASGIVRGIIPQGEGGEQAAAVGIRANQLQWLIEMSYSYPAVGAMLNMVNRKLLSEGAAIEALKKMGYKADYIGPVMASRLQPPSTEVALTAELEGNLDAGSVRAIMEANGDDPATHDWRYETAGQAPPIGEMVRLWRRGLIGDDQVHSALLEGPLKNKYIPAVMAFKEVLPTFRQILNMAHTGTLTPAESLDLLIQNGYSPYLAGKMLDYALREKVTTEKDVTKAEVVNAYGVRLITRADASTMLSHLHFPQSAIDMILNLADARRHARLLDEQIGRIRAAYVGWKFDENRARALLDAAKVPHEFQDDALPAWTTEREAQSRHLSPADIKGLVKRAVLTPEQALDKLRAMGYSDEDAHYVVALAAAIPK